MVRTTESWNLDRGLPGRHAMGSKGPNTPQKADQRITSIFNREEQEDMDIQQESTGNKRNIKELK